MTLETKFTNRLAHESSPYLLQHAHNPVDWFPWGNEALQKAKNEQKPILVSIGYSACHWCHVMERESFEDEDTAAIMNEFFVNIKIDREERPDLDHIYMEALQAITGSGGWPLNMFLTPDAKPFYGGTYFPPVRAYNRMSWKETLQAIAGSFATKRGEIEEQAENLTKHIVNANSFGVGRIEDGDTFFTDEHLNLIATNLLAIADREWGGFGRAPKFPQTFGIQYLLRHFHFAGDVAALEHALLSLDRMIEGGIYDHLAGGFARYSTDAEWLAPHFEKMLYDNALLIGTLSEAYQLTGKEKYAQVISDTLSFVFSELTNSEGGFYSALDADSEGEEGKFYCWSYEEIKEILDDEQFSTLSGFYDIPEKGNWEGKIILRFKKEIFAAADTNPAQEEKLKTIREKLLMARSEKVRPALDDKCLLGWNALMISACCKAYAATGNESMMHGISGAISFLENKMFANGEWFHTWKNDEAKHPAFLEDLCFLAQAYIHLQEISGRQDYLLRSRLIVEYIVNKFSDEEQVLFYYTSADQQDVILRKKEMYDGAVPSANAVMASNLHYLGIVFDKPDWIERATRMVSLLGKAIIRYPGSFGAWALAMQTLVCGVKEIAVIGKNYHDLCKQINSQFLPNKIIQTSKNEMVDFPLLKAKNVDANDTEIFLCSNYACSKPVKTIKDFNLLLKN
ncbi:thioredoxin domain-containing protein [Panacibacter sp. DH6]|uniref:Thioredoxin domain-containing protein n=1 Tax=Panacibacter microcysteis TaxID=2793269 RepID=A0A931E6H4_9BACT|nr:thioredoxin domain-containing protein [Panacibacter microcysteis]MBG9376160.1 thioredoxin domain-containing protein [Panacibacter microcysteis]